MKSDRWCTACADVRRPFRVADFELAGAFDQQLAREIECLANISYGLGDAVFLDYNNREHKTDLWRRTSAQQVREMAARGFFIVASFEDLDAVCQTRPSHGDSSVQRRAAEFIHVVHHRDELEAIASAPPPGNVSVNSQSLAPRHARTLLEYPALAGIVRSACVQDADRVPLSQQLAACVFIEIEDAAPARCGGAGRCLAPAEMSLLAIHPAVQSRGLSLQILNEAFAMAGRFGHSQVQSDVLACKPWLRQLYLDNGWTLTGDTKAWEPGRVCLLIAQLLALAVPKLWPATT
eukprot:INCI2810.1.p1 GENE.INCI2810.1~~INCI2810.1.p1  ORF type:complete len:292 (+),score=27.50 INCI2810.1:196-1071(+)